MSDRAVAFLLDAPLQAWGIDSRYQWRDTDAFPSKSGVLGLVAAALGLDKYAVDERDQLAPLAGLRFSTVRLRTRREHLDTRLTDFHTIGGGWVQQWKADRGDLFAKRSVPAKAKDRSPFGTVITHRAYLTDARFLAALRGDHALVDQVATALENPCWGIWFGRKCCIPASPLLPTTSSDARTAFEALLARLPEAWRQHGLGDGRTEEEDAGSWYPNDSPISFGSRQFRSRPVKRAAT